MDLKEQKYVCALAECQSVIKAAEKLYISQPALSIYIAKLEKRLGVSLFKRQGKKFVLTYAGERYVEKASQMLEMEVEFNNEIYAIACQAAGRLRLGVSQRRGAWLIPPVVVEYEKKWPKVDLVIREGNLVFMNELLRKRELDIVILNKDDVPSGMDTELLMEEHFLLVVPVRHPINEKAEFIPGERYRKLDPKYLNGEDLILPSLMQSSRNAADTILRRYHVKPRRVRTIRSIETSLQMAAEGLGITFIREGYAVNIRYKKPINLYILDVDEPKRDVVAAYKKGLDLPEYMRSMIDILKEHSRTFLPE